MLRQLGPQSRLYHSAGQLRQQAARAGDLLRLQSLEGALEFLPAATGPPAIDDNLRRPVAGALGTNGLLVGWVTGLPLPATPAASSPLAPRASLSQGGFRGDLESRILSWGEESLRGHGTTEEVPG
jgi:hypothetical protein